MKKLISILSLFIMTAGPVVAQAANQDFGVSWSAVTGATEYRLSTRVATQPATEVTVASSATSKTVTKDIAVGQTFYAKVKACTAIWCGDYSPEATFVMPAKPATPSILGIQLIISGQ